MVEEGTIMTETLYALLTTVVTVVVTIVLNQARLLLSNWLTNLVKTEQEKKLLDYLMQGMAEVQNTLVRELKAKSDDGRLTLEEIKQVEQAAYQKAIALSNDVNVRKELTEWTDAKISSEIKQLLAKWKN
jgi:hypothetical protein